MNFLQGKTHHLEVLYHEWFKHREFWDLKRASKEARLEIHAAKNEPDKERKLIWFETLLGNLDKLFGEKDGERLGKEDVERQGGDHHIQQAIQPLSPQDGAAYGMARARLITGYLTALGTLFTVAGGGFLAPVMPFIAGGLAALFLGLVIASPHVKYHVRAKVLGCKASDIKYASKLERQHIHVRNITHRLRSDDPTRVKVDKLCATFRVARDRENERDGIKLPRIELIQTESPAPASTPAPVSCSASPRPAFH